MILEWHDLDQRFYSDEQLCALFDVSRDTVRQAVAELVQAGLLTRGRGLGTFVRPQKLEERFNPGMDFLQQWSARGAQLQTTLLAFSRGSVDPATVSTLGFDAGTKLLLIKRVRAAAKVPVAIDYRYLRADLTADWTEESARGSPLHLLWQSVALDVGEFSIEAGGAGPEEVEHLHLAANAPVLIRTLRYRDASGRCVMAGHTVHRADLARYSLTVPLSRKKGGAEPAYDRSGIHED